MSCSIEESTTINSSNLNDSNTINHQQQQLTHQTAPSSSPTLTNSHIANSLNSFSNQSNNATTNHNGNTMTATDPSPKPSLLNIINTSNSNLNQNNQNSSNTNSNNSQKIVQAGLGNQLIITTVFQGNSPQKLVTVSSLNNNNNNNNNNSSTNSSSSSSSVSSSASSSSSVGSTSPPDSSTNLSILQHTSTPILQAAINGASSSNIASSSATGNGSNTNVSQPESIRQTITLTSDHTNNSNNNNSTSSQQNIGYQMHNQYAQFVDTNSDNGQHGVSVFSPLNMHQNNTNSYYSYQSTPQQNYGQQQQQNMLSSSMNLLTTSQQQPTTTTVSLHSPPANANLTNSMSNSDFQQQQQQLQQHQQVNIQQQNQQPIYYMYQDATSLDVDQTLEYEGHVSHTAQAAPITVQWLIDNFEPAEGCSLRRSTLYNYYLHHCTEQRLEPVNPASFGKLIRSVFLGLRTRRLGTRGNSKYHYYGIRVKVSSLLNQLSDDHTFAIRNHPMSLSPTGSPGPSHQANSPPPPKPPSKRAKTSHNSNSSFNTSTGFENANIQNTTQEYKPVINQENPQQQPPPLMTVIIANNGNMVTTKTAPATTTIAKALKQNDNRSNVQLMPVQQQQQGNELGKQHQQQQQHQQQIDPVQSQQQAQHQQQTQHQQHANNTAVINGTELTEDELNQMLQGGEAGELPIFVPINLETLKMPAGCCAEDARKFEELYKDQCKKILDLVVGLRLNDIENIWHMFWRSPLINHKFYEEKLSTSKFMALCECEEVIEYIKQSDYQFYHFCIEILIPDVLGNLPPNLVQSIRQLAKHMDSWLKNALVNVPEAMRKSKMQVINTFSMTLRRYTSLNHLAQTVKNSLQNENILTQMLHDITKVDFGYIKEQAKWTCDCDETMINRFEVEFKESLSNYTSTMDNWITWLDKSVSVYLQQFERTDRYAKMAKQFLLKWSFLCSSIIRDLTLRSAASFGSFHLIRLLYDEYMYFIIEHKIAHEFNLTPLAVMGCEELRPISNLSSTTSLNI